MFTNRLYPPYQWKLTRRRKFFTFGAFDGTDEPVFRRHCNPRSEACLAIIKLLRDWFNTTIFKTHFSTWFFSLVEVSRVTKNTPSTEGDDCSKGGGEA